ncbi:MAG: hypothetical protein GXC76_10025 [Rhodanobacteraceae bacterium]|jgi:hypothetical protein|nr:hypothetical protein [Rhodanobacteraceae bacterium]
MPEAPPRPRRRRWPYLLLALALLAGGAALLLRHYTRPDALSALLVTQTRSLLGAELSLGAGAHYGFVPKLRAVLPRPALRASATTPPFVTADALEAVLPWRNLWSDRYEIERIDLLRPRLDLDALDAWLATLPPAHAAPPDVRFALRIEDGQILHGGQPLARGVNLRFASAGDLAAWLAQWRTRPDTTTLLPPLAGHAEAAEVRIDEVRLEGVQVEMRDGDAPPEPR